MGANKDFGKRHVTKHLGSSREPGVSGKSLLQGTGTDILQIFLQSMMSFREPQTCTRKSTCLRKQQKILSWLDAIMMGLLP